jgi:hypothetical protein
MYIRISLYRSYYHQRGVHSCVHRGTRIPLEVSGYPDTTVLECTLEYRRVQPTWMWSFESFESWCTLLECTVRSLLNEGSFLLTHCHQKFVRKEISRPVFLDVSRGFNKLYRLTSSFFALRKYFDTHFWWQCVMPGVVWWVVWAESRIQF